MDRTEFCALNKLNKQTDLKRQHSFILFYFVYFGGPCHLSSFTQCSGDQIFLSEQLVYQVIEKINISEYKYLINIVI